MRKRHVKSNSEDTWFTLGTVLVLTVATIGVAIIAFHAFEEPIPSAFVESELLRACELVSQFELNANRFPIGLDEVEFVSTSLFFMYFSNELAAHIFANGPNGGYYECKVPKSVAS